MPKQYMDTPEKRRDLVTGMKVELFKLLLVTPQCEQSEHDILILAELVRDEAIQVAIREAQENQQEEIHHLAAPETMKHPTV